MLKHVGGWYQKPIFILATAREYDGSLSSRHPISPRNRMSWSNRHPEPVEGSLERSPVGVTVILTGGSAEMLHLRSA